jgi:hypothetical protein
LRCCCRCCCCRCCCWCWTWSNRLRPNVDGPAPCTSAAFGGSAPYDSDSVRSTPAQLGPALCVPQRVPLRPSRTRSARPRSSRCRSGSVLTVAILQIGPISET